MIKKNRAGLTVIAIVLIAISIALGLSWRDSFWMLISFSVAAILCAVFALRLKNYIVGGYIALLMISSCLLMLDSSSIVPTMILILAFCASLFGFWTGVFGALFYREFLKQFCLLIGLSLLCFPVMLFNSWAQAYVASLAYIERTENLLPLVRSIEKFQQQEGAPPKSLSALVPTYIDSIPKSELRTRSIAYKVLDGTCSWELRANCTNGIRTFDTIFYRPTHDYSDYSHLGHEIGHGFFVDYSGP